MFVEVHGTPACVVHPSEIIEAASTNTCMKLRGCSSFHQSRACYETFRKWCPPVHVSRRRAFKRRCQGRSSILDAAARERRSSLGWINEGIDYWTLCTSHSFKHTNSHLDAGKHVLILVRHFTVAVPHIRASIKFVSLSRKWSRHIRCYLSWSGSGDAQITGIELSNRAVTSFTE